MFQKIDNKNFQRVETVVFNIDTLRAERATLEADLQTIIQKFVSGEDPSDPTMRIRIILIRISAINNNLAEAEKIGVVSDAII